MKISFWNLTAALVLICVVNATAATVHYVDLNCEFSEAPYTDWSTAATNIQDAIDVCAEGDTVLVTNGVYASGGWMIGESDNRVVLDKAITLQSVNGPEVTTIQGSQNPDGFVRCAYLVSDSTLTGFTLRGGSAPISGDVFQQQSGGGVWCDSASCLISNCIVVSNSAAYAGGGAYQGTLVGCTVAFNRADVRGGGTYNANCSKCFVLTNSAGVAVKDGSVTGYGGAVYGGKLDTSAIIGNSADVAGGAYQGTFVNCTIMGNIAQSGSGYGGVYQSTLTNCIVYYNLLTDGTTNNGTIAVARYCCFGANVFGTGNFSTPPQLFVDGIHLIAGSPCIGAGTNMFSGSDIFGEPWKNPPVVGCAEFTPKPFILEPRVRVTGDPVGLMFTVTSIAGQPPFTYAWLKDGVPIEDNEHLSGTHTTNLVVIGLGLADAGSCQLIVSNAFGVVTSAVASAVFHFVDASATNPVVPYLAWDTAATNIQDAIAAALAGEIVLVTNGLYSTGGKSMDGIITNRVSVDKPILVQSVNGADMTIIQGAWDPVTTNGPLAVRCAWLTDGAVLDGFTLMNGATRSIGNWDTVQTGGGAWCSSTNGIVANCVLTNNRAIYGAGIAFGTLRNSLVGLNIAFFGGGAYYANLNNCTVVSNFTVFSARGAGTSGGLTRNSIVLYNYNYYGPGIHMDENNYYQANYSYSCTRPPVTGTGNINGAITDPQMLDLFHIAATSPLRGAGGGNFASGFDLDGEPWASPPSMGCDEVIEANLTGPISVDLRGDFFWGSQTNLPVNRSASFFGTVSGRLSRVEWSFGDGQVITNLGDFASHQWTNSGDYSVTFRVFNADNPLGVSTNMVVNVVPLTSPQLGNVLVLTNGFQFQFSGQSGANYIIQSADDLTPPVTWQTIQTINNSSGGTHQITDASTPTETRFYRVLAQ